MPLIVQARFPSFNGVPEDDCVNTWAFGGTLANGEAGALEVASRLFDFYAVTPSGGTIAVNDYLSGSLDLEVASFKIYNFADAEPRAPIYDEVQGFAGSNTGSPIPREIACCLSFRAAMESGTPPARRKGRVFIGPLSSFVFNGDPTGPPGDIGPGTEFIDDLRAAAITLLAANDASVFWAVWSRADGVFREVVAGSIDNAFDTQRRRGVRPTVKYNFT